MQTATFRTSWALTLYAVLGAGCATDAMLDGGGVDAGPDVVALDGAVANVPRVEVTACRFNLSEYAAADVPFTCGDLIVYENRDTAEREIRIHFVRIGDGATDNPPAFLLTGGPGGSVEGTLLDPLPPIAVQIASAERDLILFDPRGVGRSEPRLECPLPFDREIAPGELAESQNAALLECLPRLETLADLRAYDTRALADDVDDLRRALGYSVIDLVGFSFGTRIALEVLRHHEGIRAVVLDAVTPPNVPHYLLYPRAFMQGLRELESLCEADEECGDAYSDLYSAFLTAASDLEAAPLPVPAHGFALTGAWFVEDIYVSLRQTNRLKALPRFIDAVARRDVAIVEAFYSNYSSLHQPSAMFDANGMNRSVLCSDRWPYVDDAGVEAALEGVPLIVAEHFRSSDIAPSRALCNAWPSRGLRPTDLLPVSSGVPVLLLSGELDPRTPPAMADAVAVTLSDVQNVVVPAAGHVVSSAVCTLTAILGFLADPEVQVSIRCPPIRFEI